MCLTTLGPQRVDERHPALVRWSGFPVEVGELFPLISQLLLPNSLSLLYLVFPARLRNAPHMCRKLPQLDSELVSSVMNGDSVVPMEPEYLD